LICVKATADLFDDNSVMLGADNSNTLGRALIVFLKVWLYVIFCIVAVFAASGLFGNWELFPPGQFGIVVELIVLIFAFKAFQWLRQSLITTFVLAVGGILVCLLLYAVFVSEYDDGGSLIGLAKAFITIFSIPISVVLTLGYLLWKCFKGGNLS